MVERLSRAAVVEQAADLADEIGLDALSFTKLARSLDVTPPAIYRHLDDLDHLKREISKLASEEAAARISAACAGVAGFDSLTALALALREWAIARPGRYAALQTVPTPDEDHARSDSNAFVAALSTALRAYRLVEDDFTHAVRFIRSTMHGFIALELAGGFRREQSVDSSYQLAILAMHRALTEWPPVAVVPPMLDSTASLVQALAKPGLTIATAESLTGGLLAAELVSVPGASRVFVGGVVAYHPQLKHTLLDVDADRLAETGPVDPMVAEQLAEGARHACAVNGRPADLGLATTGVAGPDPDPQTGQAPGTVYLGIATAAGARSVRLALVGDRPTIRTATVAAAVAEALTELPTLETGR